MLLWVPNMEAIFFSHQKFFCLPARVCPQPLRLAFLKLSRKPAEACGRQELACKADTVNTGSKGQAHFTSHSQICSGPHFVFATGMHLIPTNIPPYSILSQATESHNQRYFWHGSSCSSSHIVSGVGKRWFCSLGFCNRRWCRIAGTGFWPLAKMT